MKNNILLGISICLLLCCTLPAAASNNTLGIFGNANEDSTINMQDVEYTQRIILGFDDQTELADAKYDDKVDILDVTQTELVILGREKELTIMDSADRIVTVDMPVERVISIDNGALETLRALGVNVEEEVVGVSTYILENPQYWPELQDKSGFEFMRLDYEKIVELDENVRILGEIFSEKGRMEEYIAWYHSYDDLILSRTGGLEAKDKTHVLYLSYPNSCYPALKAITGSDGDHPLILNAGGINIAADLTGGTSIAVDKEWIVEQNPDVIIGKVVGGDFTGYSVDGAESLGNMKGVRDTLIADPALGATKAVEDGNVFIICTDLNKAAVHVVGTAYLAKCFYPELFEDIQPESILKEYYEKWQGVPYQGIYVYPPLAEN
jgi:iron complex transport system substrate-binding protein